MVDENRARIRELMEAARDAHGWTQQDLAHAADVSLSSVSRVERGQVIEAKVERKIESALGWQRGSLNDIRDGGEPTPEPPPEPEPERSEYDELRDRAAALQEQMSELMRRIDQMDEKKRGA